MFGHGRQHMGKVMGDMCEGQTGLARRAGAGVIGVKIAGHGFGGDAEEGGEGGDVGGKAGAGGGRVEVADVGGGENLAEGRDREGGFLLGTEGKDRAGDRRMGDGERGETAGAAQDLFAVVGDQKDGVVGGVDDVAIVEKKEVGDGGKIAERFGVVGDDGGAGWVAAGGDDGGFELAQEQVMERGAGEHQAEIGIGGRDIGGDGGGGFGAQQNDGGGGRGEKGALGGGDGGEFFGGGERGGHDGEWLAGPGFAGAQAGDGGVVTGEGEELEAGEALEGDGGALAQRGGGGEDGCGGEGLARGIAPGETGATSRAGVGLGVKPAVGRIGVFGFAGIALGEIAHRGAGAIEREGMDDAETGAAVGATGKGIKMAAVGGIVGIGFAIVAKGEIWGRDSGAGGAWRDDKLLRASGGKWGGGEDLGRGVRRGFGFEADAELGDGGSRSFELDLDAACMIADKAGKGVGAGEAINKGPETDALDHAAKSEASADHISSSTLRMITDCASGWYGSSESSMVSAAFSARVPGDSSSK